MKNMEEKRTYSRLTIHRIAKYSTPPNYIDAFICSLRNISGGGLCLKAKEHFNNGEKLQIEFELPGDINAVSVVGEVVWCDKSEFGEKEPFYYLGIKFVSIEKEQREKIVEFVTQRLKMCVKDELGSTDANSKHRNSILIIDDDPVTRDMIKRIFQDTFTIYEAADGYAGVEIAKENSPTLILLDMLMPALDGLSTLLLLRDFEETKNIPVIMLTAVKDREKISQVIKEGATDYILKPFSPDRLLSRIKAILKD